MKNMFCAKKTYTIKTLPRQGTKMMKTTDIMCFIEFDAILIYLDCNTHDDRLDLYLIEKSISNNI